MKNQDLRRLKLEALGVILFHFLVVVLHSIPHEVLLIKPTLAQLAFIIPVILVAPLVAGNLLLKSERRAAVLLVISMTGSFFFGLYYHFIADTIDHVAHVAGLQPVFWTTTFIVTAYLLAFSEVVGVFAGFLILKQS